MRVEQCCLWKHWHTYVWSVYSSATGFTSVPMPPIEAAQ